MSKARFDNLADLVDQINIPVSEIYRIVQLADQTAQDLQDHKDATDPHPQYYNEERGDIRYVRNSILAQPNGVATLDNLGKLTFNQIPDAALGGLSYQGTWDANTNTPTLFSGQGTRGYFYKVNVAGNTDLDGITDWKAGDWAIYDGSAWQKIDQTEVVQSVNGYTGQVDLNTDDVAEGVTNLYHTDQRASDAAPVQTVFNRTGDVVAQDGDYSASQVVFDPASSDLTFTRVQAVIEELNTKVNAHINDTGDPYPQYTTPTEAANAAPVQSVNGFTGSVSLSTDEVNEGSTNLYFTNARASSAAPVQSVNGLTGNVSLDFDNYNGWRLRTNGTDRGIVTSGESVNFVAGTNVDVAYNSVNNTVTISSTDTDENYFLTGLSFNDTNGTLTASMSGAPNRQVVLDGRYILLSEKGQADGVATLDANAKIPLSQLSDSVLGQVQYEGTWNAATNTPTLPATPAQKGSYYVVNTAGSFSGLDFVIGDWIISNGTSWEKVDNTDAVTSVAGRTGNVTLTKSDVGLDNVSNVDTTNASNLSSGTLPAGRFTDTSHGNRSGGTLHAVASTSVAGFMSATDKSKLDGLESGAQVNSVDSVNGQTGTVNLDTGDIAENGNLYFTNSRARNAISVSGDLSYNPTTGVISFNETYSSATELLNAIKTVDGSGSGLDADTVDGISGGQFLRSDTNDTYTGSVLTINNNLDMVGPIRHSGDSNTYIQFNAADTWRVVTGGGQRLAVNNSGIGVNGNIDVSGDLKLMGSDSYIWTPNTTSGFTGLWDSNNDSAVWTYQNDEGVTKFRKPTAHTTQTGNEGCRVEYNETSKSLEYNFF